MLGRALRRGQLDALTLAARASVLARRDAGPMFMSVGGGADTGSVNSQETRPVNPSGPRSSRRLTSLLVRILAAVVGLGIIAFVIFVILFITHYGDQGPEPGLVIKNTTQSALLIFDVIGPGEEALAIKIPPETAKDSGIECAAGTLVARTLDGVLVARRGPFPSCNEDEWVISSTPSSDPSSSGGGNGV
jgi:hypothetical protein